MQSWGGGRLRLAQLKEQVGTCAALRSGGCPCRWSSPSGGASQALGQPVWQGELSLNPLNTSPLSHRMTHPRDRAMVQVAGDGSRARGRHCICRARATSQLSPTVLPCTHTDMRRELDMPKQGLLG